MQKLAPSVGSSGPCNLPAHEQYLINILCFYHSRHELQILLKSQSDRHKRPVVPPHGALTLIRQPPHTEVDQARGTRAHTEYRALRHDEVVLRQLCKQAKRLLTSLMTHKIVERTPH